MYKTNKGMTICAQNLGYAIRILKTKLEKGVVDESTLDLVWTMVRNYGRTRAGLKRLNTISPEAMADKPLVDGCYTLDGRQKEVLRRALMQMELIRSACLRQIAESQSRLARDLTDLNDWWFHLSVYERRAAFQALKQVTGEKDPAKVLSRAKGEKRLNLLIFALWYVDQINRAVREMERRLKRLTAEEFQQVKASIRAYAGVDPNIWWDSTSEWERIKVLRAMLKGLEADKKAAKALSKARKSGS